MQVIEAPWLYLTPTPIEFGKQGAMLLQDPGTSPPVLSVKMVPQAVPVPQGPQAAVKGL